MDIDINVSSKEPCHSLLFSHLPSQHPQNGESKAMKNPAVLTAAVAHALGRLFALQTAARCRDLAVYLTQMNSHEQTLYMILSLVHK